MFKFTQGKGWRKSHYRTKVSGDGTAEKQDVEKAVSDFEKKYPDFEIVDWTVQCKIVSHSQGDDSVEIYTEQYLDIQAKKRRKAPGKKAQKLTKK